MSPRVPVLVKICGLTSEEALEAAIAAGADALGFVLAPSPRRVSLARARELLRRVPRGIERVAVFGRATRAELEPALELDVDALQAECASSVLPPLAAPRFFLPVVRDGAGLLERLGRIPRVSPGTGRRPSLCGMLVLDGPRGGGRGIPVALERARRAARLRPLVLAGGLDPGNVAERVRAVRPSAVDASSGLEHAPGSKDPARIRAFVVAVRAVEVELAAGEVSA